jgi:hypothetical protein
MTSPVPSVKASSTTPKVTGTVRSKNPLKGAVEIIPVSSYNFHLAPLLASVCTTIEHCFHTNVIVHDLKNKRELTFHLTLLTLH